METLAVHHARKDEKLRLRVHVLLKDSHLPSPAIEGFTDLHMGLPGDPLPGQEESLVKTC